ncbi:saccharopine dehydrogenase family protein [Halopiger goleimassiliensis]|uniref:saccharopine dehydrogenase family protein n=1 Tax=Halopiger goleimassiliensis TaxID=1293048 RepID=UPI0006780FB4|nr:saccharopine dehydrogenase NADP-binding domain-containing protein [Halopiger goleimassiliensis]
MDSLLVYGAYGYTGRLIAREAVARGGSPIAAGRDARRVADQAESLDVEGRVFDLESDDVAAHLADVDAVVNCAGPFTETAEPMLEACLASGTNYLDITGEFTVFDRLSRRDQQAAAADVTVLPGVGFEVVPSDCLAAFLASQLPAADELALAVRASPTVSHGTARTILDLAGTGVVRRNGRLLQVPTAYQHREIDFGDGPTPAVTAPWGDVVTAAHSTGIETIEVYVGLPPAARPALPLAGPLAWMADRGPVAALLERALEAVDGPDERQLATGEAVVWGEATDSATGRTVRARVRTPNPYALTAETAVTAAERVLAGDVDAGFQTPATAFGSEFVLECAGTERERLVAPPDPEAVDRSLEADD